MSDAETTSPLGQVQAYWSKVKGLIAGLSRPARVFAATTLLAAIAIGGWWSLRSQWEPYSVLFSQLDDQDSAAVIAKLKELKVPYRVSASIGAIEVPEARVHELRIDLAGSGVVHGGGIGFEGFDKMRLGATEFEQRVMYRRAMEGELARTIGSISAVQSARVHLVLPEKSVFAARREPASASVVVRLKGGRFLGQSEVQGVVSLVAAAVPGLEQDHVSLVTTEGNVLHRPHIVGPDGVAAAGGDGDETSRAKMIESQLEERARTLLERLVGPGHADVRVSAEIDLARVERTEDRYDPQRTAIRSESQTIERSPDANAADDSAAGVPGAESNLPSGAAPETPAPTASANAKDNAITRESHTRNYEIDHIIEKRVNLQGAIRRLTVAVVVDGVPAPDGTMEPRSREDLDKLESLVRSAVGVDPQRQDVITVESIPFLPTTEPEPIEAPVETPKLPPVVMKYWPFGAGGVGLFAMLGLVMAVRRTNRKKAEEVLKSAEKQPLLLKTTPVAGKLGIGSPETTAEQLGPQSEPRDYREEALRRAKEDPATAALVLRHWLGTAVEERAQGNAA
ncbi:MAG: flagellar basal-body MS-ring/collar protein FliF [Polyangiaceae bacterium]